MAKIAVDSQPRTPNARLIASGDGWTVSDVVCTAGPSDRSFEEQHNRPSIAIILGGSFQYRASVQSRSASRELMTPGSLLLGSAGQCFECGHEHAIGDRCLAFAYSPEFFDRLAFDTGAPPRFSALRLPPLRELSALIARASAAHASTSAAWDEIAVDLAAQSLQLDQRITPGTAATPASTLARVTRVIRRIEHQPEQPHSLESLAQGARLSPYHFLRTFESLTGVTPHQYVLRARLRRAAIRIASESTKILDIALDCGFGDISNFNRTFRAEFGLSPRAFRARA